jgi:integrase
MKHNVRFAPERRKEKNGEIKTSKIPLFADIRFNAQRINYFTGYRINYDQFDFQSQRIKKNNVGFEGNRKVQYNTINNRLTDIESKLELYFREKTIADKQVVIKLLNDVCKKSEIIKVVEPEPGLLQYFDMYIIEANVSEGLRKQLKVARKHFETFASGIDYTLESVTVETLNHFKTYLEKERGTNTVAGNLKRLRAFFNYAIKQEWTNNYPFKKFKMVSEKYGTPIYITKAELDKLYTANLGGDERLERTRDIFIFQCSIGARVGDMIRLSKRNIINGELNYIPSKTEGENQESLKIPLTSRALAIIKKYEGKSKLLLPFITDQKYNVNIKDLFAKAEINREVVRLNPNTGIEETVQISAIASSHMARRTFIGTLHSAGTKNEIIKSMSGHKEKSVAFARYYKVTDLQKKKSIKGLE